MILPGYKRHNKTLQADRLAARRARAKARDTRNAARRAARLDAQNLEMLVMRDDDECEGGALEVENQGRHSSIFALPIRPSASVRRTEISSQARTLIHGDEGLSSLLHGLRLQSGGVASQDISNIAEKRQIWLDSVGDIGLQPLGNLGTSTSDDRSAHKGRNSGLDEFGPIAIGLRALRQRKVRPDSVNNAPHGIVVDGEGLPTQCPAQAKQNVSGLSQRWPGSENDSNAPDFILCSNASDYLSEDFISQPESSLSQMESSPTSSMTTQPTIRTYPTCPKRPKAQIKTTRKERRRNRVAKEEARENKRRRELLDAAMQFKMPDSEQNVKYELEYDFDDGHMMIGGAPL